MTEATPPLDGAAPIRVVYAEDQTMLRGAVVALLTMEPDIEIVSEIGSGIEVVPAVQETAPDVVLLDIELPGVNGLDLAEELRRDGYGGKVVIVTTFDRPGYLQRAIDAQVDGFLLKSAPMSEFAATIRRIVAGEQVLDPELAMASVVQGRSPLTDREREVLRASSSNATVVTLAAELHLSAGTVRNHLSSAIQKLGAQNRADALKIAEGKGWV
jgi:two-component system response regulator DesR